MMTLWWLQSGGCGGCALSLLGLQPDDLQSWSKLHQMNWKSHPILTHHSPSHTVSQLQAILAGEQSLDVLLVEGAVLQGPEGSGLFHVMSGINRPMRDVIHALAQQANYVVAVGSCSAFGGITGAGDNFTEATGLQNDCGDVPALLSKDFRSRAGLPVINIAGCPVHPQWVTETLMMIRYGVMSIDQLDALHRPRFYTDKLVHHGCLRNEYYEYKASAVKPADLGCLMEHQGCVGTLAHADCNERAWNGTGSCTRGGYPCIDCTSPDFTHLSHALLETPKVAGIPVGLPVDMPKAWFIALSTLAKAATPARIEQNATQDHIVLPPEIKRRS